MNSQLPFAYTHLIAALVHGAVLLSVVKCGILSALADSALAVFCEICLSFFLSMVYLGLLSMTAVIADPFGDDIIDLPAESFRCELWKTCGTYEASKEPPLLIKNVNDHAEKSPSKKDEDDGDGGG